jgi:glyoxylase-like metal-dependent hydrolase (beta-lactamase superfamily II)
LIEGFTRTPLKEFGAIDLLPGEKALTGEVTAIETPGHIPGRMCVLIASNGEKGLITGDSFCRTGWRREASR